MTDCNVLPIAAWIGSGECHETRLVVDTLEERFTKEALERIIGDRAYDSDPLDEELRQDFGIKLISPHRAGRRRPKIKDGRELRR